MSDIGKWGQTITPSQLASPPSTVFCMFSFPYGVWRKPARSLFSVLVCPILYFRTPRVYRTPIKADAINCPYSPAYFRYTFPTSTHTLFRAHRSFCRKKRKECYLTFWPFFPSSVLGNSRSRNVRVASETISIKVVVGTSTNKPGWQTYVPFSRHFCLFSLSFPCVGNCTSDMNRLRCKDPYALSSTCGS